MKEMKRFEALRDKFTVLCNECGSTEIWLHPYDCSDCGIHIDASCSNCNSNYRYHNFNWRLATYNDKGDEISSVPINKGEK